MAHKPNHTTPIVIGVVGVVGIIAIVLAIVLTRTKPPAAPANPPVAIAADAAVAPPVAPPPTTAPDVPTEPAKPKPTPVEILRTKICARAATGSSSCSTAENCSIDKRPTGYCGCVTQMAERHAALYLAWYSCYAGCNPAAQYDGCRADCNRTRGAACSRQ